MLVGGLQFLAYSSGICNFLDSPAPIVRNGSEGREIGRLPFRLGLKTAPPTQ